MRKRPIGLIFMVIIFILGSFAVITVFVRNWIVAFSGRTGLTGEIITDKRSLRVGDMIALELTVPDRYESLSRLRWYVNPADAGEIYYEQVGREDRSVDEEGDVHYPTKDRKAFFTAEKPGVCFIVVEGYYKQPEPRYVTKFELAVTSERSTGTEEEERQR